MQTAQDVQDSDEVSTLTQAVRDLQDHLGCLVTCETGVDVLANLKELREDLKEATAAVAALLKEGVEVSS